MKRSIRYISPFNDADVIAGSVHGLDEMLLQAPELEHLVVSVGGGGLISGALMSRDAHGRTDIRVTGVQPDRERGDVPRAARRDRWTRWSIVRRSPTDSRGGGDDGAITNELIARTTCRSSWCPRVEIRRAVREAAENNGS